MKYTWQQLKKIFNKKIIAIIILLSVVCSILITPLINKILDDIILNTYIVTPFTKIDEEPSSFNKVFNTVAFEKDEIPETPLLNEFLEKMKSEIFNFNDCQDNIQSNKCSEQLHEWASFIRNAKEIKDPLEQLKIVNVFFNEWPYIEDIDLWGKTDYWAKPSEFIKNSGDCEDFAIIKYYTLKQLGFNDEQLKIVILNDINTDRLHSVLVVNIDNINYILDNLYDKLLTDKLLRHYKPIYSFNESKKWIHFKSILN